MSYKEALAQFRREYFTKLLAEHGNNGAAAARAASVNRTDFYKRLKRAGVQRVSRRHRGNAAWQSLADA